MNKCYQTSCGIFEWDVDKNKLNTQKHGIGFEQATAAFADPRALVAYDTGHSEQEDRFHLLGMVNGVIVLLVVFTENDAIRIISARKATRQEEKRYAKQ